MYTCVGIDKLTHLFFLMLEFFLKVTAKFGDDVVFVRAGVTVLTHGLPIGNDTGVICSTCPWTVVISGSFQLHIPSSKM